MYLDLKYFMPFLKDMETKGVNLDFFSAFISEYIGYILVTFLLCSERPEREAPVSTSRSVEKAHFGCSPEAR